MYRNALHFYTLIIKQKEIKKAIPFATAPKRIRKSRNKLEEKDHTLKTKKH